MKKKKHIPAKRGRAKIKRGLPPAAKNGVKTFVGTLKMHREGNYGFLLPDDPGLEDVFVPIRRIGEALDMDRVRASYWRGSDGRLEGAVEEILERGKRYWVGTLGKLDKRYVVECPAGRKRILFRVDGEDLKGARLGDSIGIEAVSYPVPPHPGVAKVVQIFGARGDEATEIDIVILKHQLPRNFPDQVVWEAKQIAEARKIGLEEGRRDLTNLPLVTIDGETARDFDDAICVKKEFNGYRLWVAIADVSHYVRVGSPLDREALARGTSVYFTQKVIPMLPEQLSNDLCSLRPHEERMAFTAEIRFDGEGRIRETQFYKSLIQSQARLTYNQVARACLDNQAEAREKIKESLPMLETAFELFRLLRKRRLARGSLDFDLPEPEIILDLEAGDIETIVKAERNQAHMLIEEFMVAANEAVAEFITGRGKAMVYRVHPSPDPDKVEQFQTLLRNLGFQIKIPKSPRSQDFSRVLQQAKGHAEERLINHFTLRTMKQAVYSTKNEGHFGLASNCYTHFTSPIRRYPDLIVHRLLGELLEAGGNGGTDRKKAQGRLEPLAINSSRRERVAMEAEWEARDLMTALFMKKFLGEFFEGHVARVSKFGFFVELNTYFVEGLVLLEEIPSDHFVFEEKHHLLRGRRSKKVYKIGTEVRIQVSRVDLEERRVYFQLRD
jgi:ribonuclease R